MPSIERPRVRAVALLPVGAVVFEFLGLLVLGAIVLPVLMVAFLIKVAGCRTPRQPRLTGTRGGDDRSP